MRLDDGVLMIKRHPRNSFKLTDLPKRPFRNFEHYLAEQCKYLAPGHRYPCRECYGSGKLIADYERPDPCEGYKHADRVPCHECVGKGEVERSKALNWYKEHIARWREKYAEAKNKRDAEISALQKGKSRAH